MSGKDAAAAKLLEGKAALKAQQYDDAVDLLARALELMCVVVYFLCTG